MSVEERVLRLENAFATLSELAAASEARTGMVMTLLRSMDERMDQHLIWINQLGSAQANTEAKLAALTDAQIKTEQTLAAFDGRLAALTEAQIRTEQSFDARLAALTEAQIRTEQSSVAFQSKTEQALAKLAEQISGLVEAQAHADRRLDTLIDIVKEKRDGQQS